MPEGCSIVLFAIDTYTPLENKFSSQFSGAVCFEGGVEGGGVFQLFATL